jgi:predicted ABC-type ATPase
MTLRASQPRLLVFAGPNGSGKSSIKSSVPSVGIWINADEIKQCSGCTDIEAALEAEKLREYHLSKHKDFSFETVLSTDRNMDLIKRAREAGYRIDCFFVLTADPAINVFRVRTRWLGGGHGVPTDKIISRYHKSLANISRLIPLCDSIRIIDNTDAPFVIYLKNVHGRVVVSENRYWARGRITALATGGFGGEELV